MVPDGVEEGGGGGFEVGDGEVDAFELFERLDWCGDSRGIG